MEMRRLLALVTHFALGGVSTIAIAAGGAASAALLLVLGPPVQDWAEWIVPIRQTALAIGPALLIGGIAARFLLPARREFTRLRADQAPEPALPAGGVVLLAVLGAAAIAQAPVLFAWWRESRAVLEQLIPSGYDLSGLWDIPAVLVTAPLFFAVLIVVTFVLTSMGIAVVRRVLASRVFVVCLLLRAGLVIQGSLGRRSHEEGRRSQIRWSSAGFSPTCRCWKCNQSTHGDGCPPSPRHPRPSGSTPSCEMRYIALLPTRP